MILTEADIDNILSMTPYDRATVTIGVALSGGRDSVALFDMLYAAGIKIVGVNVEHGIRRESSVSDSLFAREMCQKYGVPFIGFRVDSPTFARQNSLTVEQAARQLRYGCFEEALDSGKCDLIALAHHADDQTETLLMRILRGTGNRGLVGMKKVSGRYIRPLLDFSREDIDLYVSSHGLSYVDDETNDDLRYTRNFLRAELKILKERFPSVNASFARLSRNAEEIEDYLASQTPDIASDGREAHIELSACREPLIFKRAVVKAAGALGVGQDIEERHFEALLELADSDNGKRIDLTHELVAHKDGKYLVLALRADSQQFELPFAPGAYASLGVDISVLSPDKFCPEAGVLYGDYDKIPVGAVLRNRREGDLICKFGGGTKSLGDFLTDKKIPLRKRDSLVLIAKGSEVYAVFGVDISSKLRIDGASKRVVRLSRTDEYK